jgi:hypothetical protein
MRKVKFVSVAFGDRSIYAVDECGNLWSLDDKMEWNQYAPPMVESSMQLWMLKWLAYALVTGATVFSVCRWVLPLWK